MELVGKIRSGRDGRDGSRVVCPGHDMAIRMTRDSRSQPRIWAVRADLP